MKGRIRFVENNLSFGPYKSSDYDDFINVCTQGKSTHQISLKAGNNSSILCNKIIGSLVEKK
jgi:hypothetical protein